MRDDDPLLKKVMRPEDPLLKKVMRPEDPLLKEVIMTDPRHILLVTHKNVTGYQLYQKLHKNYLFSHGKFLFYILLIVRHVQ